MSEMIERVARKLCNLGGVDPDVRTSGSYASIVNRQGARQMVDYVGDPNWMRFAATAKAVIEAMREPTDEMMMEGVQVPGMDDPDGLKAAWQVMIDKARA